MTQLTTPRLSTLDDLVKQARRGESIRLAVVHTAQSAVLETLRDALRLGIAEPLLIGRTAEIVETAAAIGWDLGPQAVIEADSDVEAARVGVELVQAGRAEALMKGYLHTDTFMHALLGNGLRQPGRRVRHVFLVDVPDCPRLLAVTDAAVNITPDLDAKAQILQNAIELMHMIGLERPRDAVISAVETVNPAIASTLDAARLTLMAHRGQIAGAEVDGPLAFDNAISERVAREKGIDSPVAGKADILLMPALVSGNVLAKKLEYHAGTTAAGVGMGLTVPLVLSPRADPPEARLVGLAMAALMYHSGIRLPVPSPDEAESTFCWSPQPDSACCPTEVR